MNKEDALSSLREFERVVDAIYGIFLDSRQGFVLVRKRIEEAQAQTIPLLQTQEPEHANLEYIDSLTYYYSPDMPGSPDARIEHVATQGNLKERNQEGGLNFIFLGNMCLITIYQFWEDYYRERIAAFMEMQKNELESTIFGDMRQLRRSIIHNGAVAIPEVEKKSELIHWFNEGELISIDNNKFQELISHVRAYLQELRSQLD